MTPEQLKLLLADTNIEGLAQKIKATKPVATEDADQYEVANHKVMSGVERPDKAFTTTEPVAGLKSETKVNHTTPVVRIAVPLQKHIVKIAATFLCGNPIQIKGAAKAGKEEKILAAIKKVWKDNKLDFKSKGLAKRMMAETEAAEIWYAEELDQSSKAGQNYWKDIIKGNFKLRCKIVSKSQGDDLYPVWDVTGDMLAFARGYFIKDGDKRTEHLDIYTAENIIYCKKDDSGWTKEPKPNPFAGKIPVIYYSQPAVEWFDIQGIIERYETQLSNLGDTNDYFGSPMVAIYGNIKSFAKKGQVGKMVEVTGDKAKIEYVTWDKSPESVKLELDSLQDLIFKMTDTPNFSFKELSGLGTFSGIALKMLFLGAHMKASDKVELFGESIQRRLNFIQNTITQVIDVSMSAEYLDLEPGFEFYLPKDNVELMNVLTDGVLNKILSRKTAISLNPLVTDPVEEENRLKAEADEAAKANTGLDDQFN